MRSKFHVFCKHKGSCRFKKIQKARWSRRRGLYYVVCTNPEGCNQKTFDPVTIRIPLKFQIVPLQFRRKREDQ